MVTFSTLGRGFVWLGILVASAGCSYRIDKQTQLSSPQTWFGKIQTEVLRPHCVACHSPPRTSGGIDLSSYRAMLETKALQPFDPAGSAVYASIVSNRMPKGKPGSVNDALKEMLKQWIAQGASETAMPPATPPPPIHEPEPTATYAYIQKWILQVHCVGCHNGTAKKGDIDLTTYDKMIDSGVVTPGFADSSHLFLVMKSGEMPPEPDRLTPAQIAAVEKWIEDGAKP